MSTFWFIAIATWACSGGLQNVVWAWAEGRDTEEPRSGGACIKQLDWMTGLGINSTAGQRSHRGRRWYGFRSWFVIAGRGSIYLRGAVVKASSQVARLCNQLNVSASRSSAWSDKSFRSWWSEFKAISNRLEESSSNSCWKSYVMLTKHQKETMFKTGAAISFVPFFPLLWHGYELAFVTKSINPHPGLVVFSILIVTNFCMRIPYLFSTNKLVFRQSFAVLIVNDAFFFFT